MEKNVVIYSLFNVSWLGLGLFLLIGPYDTGFVGFLFWIIAAITLNSVFESIKHNKVKDDDVL